MNNPPTTNKFCPVCTSPATHKSIDADGQHIECERCGNFKATRSAVKELTQGRWESVLNDIEKAAVGFWLKQQQNDINLPELNTTRLQQLREELYFPSVENQLELLLLDFGECCKFIGVTATIREYEDQFSCGAQNPSVVFALIKHLRDQGDIELHNQFGQEGDRHFICSLKISGWLRYEKIKKGKTSGKEAFMAMPFNKPNLDSVWLPRLREAVRQTGFELKRVDDEPKPGLIDTHMRLQIQRARFLIVELTHSNLGAHWEAGFAEGLGKPVIYTWCENAVNGDKPHFDVEHSLRIEWESDNIDAALRAVKATIRNSIPDAIDAD